MEEKGPVRLTPELILQLAVVAGLSLDPDRAAELARRLQPLRDGIANMDRVDLTNVEPAFALHLPSEPGK